MNHDEALQVARQAATTQGCNLQDFSLLSFDGDMSHDGKKWFFLLVCKRPAPGCAVFVTIDRETGAIVVSPGA